MSTTKRKMMRNFEIDAQPMLDRDQKAMCRVMRDTSRRGGGSFTMMNFARIALGAAAVDYASEECGEDGDPAGGDARSLERAALLFVYEALRHCDHAIIKEWPEFDTMLRQLEDLGTLGIPR